MRRRFHASTPGCEYVIRRQTTKHSFSNSWRRRRTPPPQKKGSSINAHTTNTSKYVSDHMCVYTKEMFRLLRRLRKYSSRTAFFFPTVNRAYSDFGTFTIKFQPRHICTQNLSFWVPFCVFPSPVLNRMSFVKAKWSRRGTVFVAVNMTYYDTLNLERIFLALDCHVSSL